MLEGSLVEHVYALEACNQRGGRMLSLIDLLDAGTVDLPLAAYLAAAMRHGASLLVGARPGGAGKTAVMCALLNFLPNATMIQAVGSRAVLDLADHDPHPGATCYLAHEIGDGLYYAYLWGDEARDFFALAARGHTIATNLHADTLEETRDQLCLENGVAPAHLAAVTLKVYLHVDHADRWAWKRRVSYVYESDGAQDRLLWRWDRRGAFERQAVESVIVSPVEEHEYSKLLAALRRRNMRHIEDVRRALLEV
ncbi:MAG TPA: hypothetical protein PKZ84_21620 [Anaerolineae bacterium]|nr:hypothetical protein [Anaerolineae bacterium]HQI87189.1 hypothetical protein [Anaerolineae bacterium]